jgi:hypothetical protein
MIATETYHSNAERGGHTSRMTTLDVDIGRDFTATPGGRYRRLGPFSGEEFRDILAPKLRNAIADGRKLRVRIDSVKRSYSPSFLDEAFAGLVRDAGFTKAEVQEHLELICETPRFEKYRTLAESYIESLD